MIIFWIALVILAPIYRSFYVNNEIIAMYGYLACFDGIAIGCCTAVIISSTKFKQLSNHCKEWDIQKKIWATNLLKYGAILMLVIVYFYTDVANNMIMGFSLVAISTAILLVIGTSKEESSYQTQCRLSKIICWFGRNSYELYLFHIIVLALMLSIYDKNALGNYEKLIWMVVFFVTATLLAGIIAKLYSRPLNKKIRQLLFGLLLKFT